MKKRIIGIAMAVMVFFTMSRSKKCRGAILTPSYTRR